MSFYSRIIFPLLRRMDAETAHERALAALELAQASGLGKALLRAIAGHPAGGGEVDFCGLRFPNVLGVAAGLDKDARVAKGLGLLGFGHVEVGTLTPQAQKGNEKPRVFRLPECGGIINRMGFPNGGVENALPRLRRLNRPEGDQEKRRWILGVSLGKQKETPLEGAAADYIAVMRAVYAEADYLAVNISSPNTPGLRHLQGGALLDALLGPLMDARAALAATEGRAPRPLLVKIAPDLSERELEETLGAIERHGVDGVIATNTTLSREGAMGSHAEEAGGLSGSPLMEKSTEMVRMIHAKTNGRLPIIAVGGVRDAAGVREKLEAGARLVQIYTGFVYEGPGMAGRVLGQLRMY